jgi:alpha-L-arabinofuranosidase
MKAADPTIKIGAVAVTGEDSYANYTDHPAVNPRTGASHNGWTPVMLATLKSVGITPDFLIYHR